MRKRINVILYIMLAVAWLVAAYLNIKYFVIDYNIAALGVLTVADLLLIFGTAAIIIELIKEKKIDE